jgi:hypothetical protein
MADHSKTGQNRSVIECHSITGPFDFRIQIDHLNTGLVRYSDGHYSAVAEMHKNSICSVLETGLNHSSYFQNRDGFIDKEDLHDMLASLGKDPTDEYLEDMMSDAPGAINFTMFLTLFGERLQGTDPEDVIRNAFGCFDEENQASVHPAITLEPHFFGGCNNEGHFIGGGKNFFGKDKNSSCLNH